MVTQRHIKLDHFFHHISISLEFSRINPINERSARQTFMKTKQNPQFNYDPYDPYLSTMQAVLKEIHLDDTPVGLLLDAKRKELIQKIDLMQSIGTPLMPRMSAKLYTPPNEKLVEHAYELLKLPAAEKSINIKRQEARAMIKTAFKELGFKWRIATKEMVTSARVNPLTRTLELRKKERFSRRYVQRLIAHELGIHALRAENGSLQPLRIFLHGTAGYLEVEEGLAAYAEDYCGLMSTSILRNYAGRVIAIAYAQNHDFVQTYKHLRKFFNEKTAWKIALRVKRGLTDTSVPGAFTKDAIYLRGYRRIKRFVKRGGDISQLMVGKISIKDLEMVEYIPDVKPPKYLPFDLFKHDVLNGHDDGQGAQVENAKKEDAPSGAS